MVLVLVMVAVISATTAALIVWQRSVRQNLRALSEKMAVLDVQSGLHLAMSDGGICSFELTNAGAWIASAPATFDSSTIGTSTPPTISLNQILTTGSASAPVLLGVGSPVSDTLNYATVQSIQIGNIAPDPTTANRYTASLQVTINPVGLVRPIRPISVPITLNTSASGSTQTVANCGGGGISGGGYCVVSGLNCTTWTYWGSATGLNGSCPPQDAYAIVGTVAGGTTGFLCVGQ